jgi:polyisoprenyl-phosphate glycosyltransferase
VRVTISIITPAFNEATNLQTLYARLSASMEQLGHEWEWLLVDDHSRDDTFDVIERLSALDQRVRGIRLARNSGSHVAIRCGLQHAQGEAAIVMAADLQDPPELIGRMIDVWREGGAVVWAVRRSRQSISGAMYYWIMRRLVGMSDMPAHGADFFLADRAVVEAFRRCRERTASVLALVTWLGFRQVHIEYDKESRRGGQSGWTLSRKLNLVLDSIVGFSAFPIRLCGLVGALLLAAGLLVGLAAPFVLPGLGMGVWLALAAMVGLTGIQLLAMAIVGEYVWHTLEETRDRPQYLIERLTGRHPAIMDSGSTR